MEIIIKDWSPLGTGGTGKNAHVFNPGKRDKKEAAERRAIAEYSEKLRPWLRDRQVALLNEALEDYAKLSLKK
jgi:hypothetical protein